eukprot:TRINITY_DN66404_c0_g1_i1.p1 TRINITY_DN66404_c0_g1~~TRINITY_DN66404_c0_g1_i1.p1  ORF type:complete len:371 (-),score=31.93 TRINITY_DN66404_c0_g1_i1:63-1106(-)
MANNSFSVLYEKEDIERRPYGSSKDVCSPTSFEKHRMDLLKKVINNKIITLRLYYAMLFMHKWRQEVAQQKEYEAIVLVQRYTRGYLARKQVDLMKQHQAVKIAIYEKVKAAFEPIIKVKKRDAIFCSLCGLMDKFNMDLKKFIILRVARTIKRKYFKEMRVKVAKKETTNPALPRFIKSYKKRMLEVTHRHKTRLQTVDKKATIGEMRKFSAQLKTKGTLEKLCSCLQKKVILRTLKIMRQLQRKDMVNKMKRPVGVHHKHPSLRLTKNILSSNICKTQIRKRLEFFWPVMVIQRAYKRWKFSKFLAVQNNRRKKKFDDNSFVAVNIQNESKDNTRRCIIIQIYSL